MAHLGMELLKSKVPGLKPVHIPYQGNLAVITDLTGRHSTLAPEAASLTETGLRDFNLEVRATLVGPARLSKAAQERLALEVPTLMRTPDIRQRLFAQGWNTVGSSPESLRNRVAQETATMRAIIKVASVKAD